MPSIRQNKQKRKIVPGKLLKAVILSFVCIYFVGIIISQQSTLSKCESVSAEYTQKIQEEKLKNKQLNDEHAQTSSDEYLQRKAREKLGLVKANERIFIDVTSGE